MTNSSRSIRDAGIAADRLFQIMDLEREKNLNEGIRLKKFKKSLEFRNVDFRYGSGPLLFNDLNLAVPVGSTCGIAGNNGSGKSSLAALMLALYQPRKGKILIDGTDINTISMQSIRSVLGLVQQDMYLFPGTIMDNLKLMDKKVPDSKVYDAIDKIKLKDFFKKHSLNKKVVEKGANLSIGEKQVISLARAMVLDQDILVLDEATSHMDPYTEKTVTNAIKNLAKHKTLIIIAHRLSTIKNADNILLLSDGEIKEEGNHQTLIKAKGLYWKFYELQFGE